MSEWSFEKVRALAPDGRSLKAAEKLANRARWPSLGHAAGVVWGECLGSGRQPYKVQASLVRATFKCSCPSRKRPCKHSIALGLLWAASPDAFPIAEKPPWVTIDRPPRKKDTTQKPPDPAAQAKRIAARRTKIDAGLLELDLWLRDLVRRGLAEAPGHPYQFWDAAAARLVDAQAGALAARVRRLPALIAGGGDWPARLMAELGQLYLITLAFRRLDTLPPDVQADVRTAVGWPDRRADLEDAPRLSDEWLVLGRYLTREERLTIQRTWLHGAQTGRSALLLDFAFGDEPPDRSVMPGTAVTADLIYYPSATPLRAFIAGRPGQPQPLRSIPALSTIAAALDRYSAALAANAWLAVFPLSLADVTPFRERDRWWLRDRAGATLPLPAGYEHGWTLLALSGGHALTLFGEWDGQAFWPLTLVVDGRWLALADIPEVA